MKSQFMVEYGAPLVSKETATPVPDGTEVLIRVRHCGVCHSDIHTHDGYIDFGGGRRIDSTSRRELPFALGHEIQGEIAAFGPQAESCSDWTIGDKVAVYPWIGCSKCDLCHGGNEHLCDNPRIFGNTVNGGFGDHVVVPHPRYLLDYGSIPDAVAGILMCSGVTAYRALKKVGVNTRPDSLAIIGLGGVGLMAVKLARALYGATKIVGVDIDERKLDAARSAGADDAFNAAEKVSIKNLVKSTGGGVTSVIDFVGSEDSTSFSTRIVRKGGHVVVVGLFGGSLSMPIPMIPWREISISGSCTGSLQEARETLALFSSEKISAIPIEGRPMEQANEALDDLRNGRIVGRVVLRS